MHTGALAALALALIPYFTGQIIDFATIDQNQHAFTVTTLKLLMASLACAIFTGIRGGLFTVGITRLNVRLRTNLFSSLLAQDMGFYDTAKSGECGTGACRFYAQLMFSKVAHLCCFFSQSRFICLCPLPAAHIGQRKSQSSTNRIPPLLDVVCCHIHHLSMPMLQAILHLPSSSHHESTSTGF